jgi:hypothetical protein
VPSADQPVADVLADLQRALGGAGLRWFLFGAQAAILHGVARLSADVDVTVDLGARSSGDLAGILTAGGFDLLVSDRDGFVEATRVMPFVHRSSGMPVDVVLAGPGLEEQFLAGAELHRVGAATIPVARAEDLIAMKILARRPRDLEDVAAMIEARRADLDLDHARRILRLLEGALDRADLVSELERIARASGGSADRDA